VKVKQTVGIKRLIFISSMGIYDEVPGERYGSIIEPYRKAPAVYKAAIAAASCLLNASSYLVNTLQSADAFLDRPSSALGQGLAQQSRLQSLQGLVVSALLLFPLLCFSLTPNSLSRPFVLSPGGLAAFY
jgi:hypothetical protein